MLPRPKQRLYRAEWQPGKIREQAWKLGEHMPVVCCIRDQKEQAIDRVIASLEVQSTLEGLRIVQPHLHLHGRPATDPENHGVPSPLLKRAISRRRKYNFGPKGQRGGHEAQH